MIRVLVVCALVAATQAQYYCSLFGGACGIGCSSYKTSSLPLCPSGYRCCSQTVSTGTDYCSQRYRGRCVNPGTPCSGPTYKGSSFNICPNAVQVCCVAGTGGTVTQSPTNPPKVNPTTGSGCGTSKVLGANRVVGGSNAQKGAWPWQVSMLKNGGHSCGGTLINDQWVVTAGHCFRTSYSTLHAAMGDHYIRSRDGSESVVAVSKVFVNSGFDRNNPANNANDIALMKLSQKVRLGTNTVNSACLPSQGESFQSAKECYVTGWGLTRGTQDRYTLQQVSGPIVPNSQCSRYWGSKVTNGVVCHGNGRHGACKGDSGGPLVCRKNGKFTLVGVVSFGTPECNKYPYPTVYTRVANYRSWIDQTIRNNP